MDTSTYASITVNQLKQLLEDCNEDKEIRIWVERTNEDGNTFLEGRRLIGVTDDPNDKYCCLVAGLYYEEEEEE